MPPKHIAQTSTEAKKAYKKNGPVISERTHKQLQRGYELEQRAEREREAENRRKLAKEKRVEREWKEEQIRKQMGVGLATQLIGYSHTQAHLKKGMEAFLGINKKKEEQELRGKEEEKKREDELAKKLEMIAQDIEREPFDDDEELDSAMLDLPIGSVHGGGWVVDELDDDTLLEVHDPIMSDPVEGPTVDSTHLEARSATAPPESQQRPSDTCKRTSITPAAPIAQPNSPEKESPKEDLDFTRTHGPVNRAIEAALSKLPGEIIELLSEDLAAVGSDWTPAHGLLFKLNHIGLPPHRLRIKAGCVLMCLRDLNTSSQLSKSQHVRVLKVGNERLECVTLDGQLAGTKTVITRVPFPAKYRNDDKFPFVRNQYPVRVAVDYVTTELPRELSPSGFKLPSMNGRHQRTKSTKRPTPPSSKSRPQTGLNPSFKLPGLPASKTLSPATRMPSAPSQSLALTSIALDGWDDFLESGTQIARELSADSPPEDLRQPCPTVESAPPLSTQDLDFSLEDLDDEPMRPTSNDAVAKAAQPKIIDATPQMPAKPRTVPPGPFARPSNKRRPDLDTAPMRPSGILQKRPRPSTKRSMAQPPAMPPPSAKKSCTVPPSHVPVTSMSTTASSKRFSDFHISTQDANSFFDDDDEFGFGSPPIAV